MNAGFSPCGKRRCSVENPAKRISGAIAVLQLLYSEMTMPSGFLAVRSAGITPVLLKRNAINSGLYEPPIH
jgi:hypothetical protein